MEGGTDLVHGTAIAVGRYAVLIRGPSGSGKSDLALRCLALGPSPLLPTPAKLVSDDQVLANAGEGRLILSAPPTISGLIEVRGVGIARVEIEPSAELMLVAELGPHDHIERFPDPLETVVVLGVAVPLIRMAAFESSAAIKLLIALNKIVDGPSAE